LLASISISALPPSNGFISEWMTFQALLGSQNIADMSLKLAIPFAVFSLALTSGLAIACFVKAFGITFLGLHRSENAKHAKEVNGLMNFGMVLMALVVVSLMMFAPFYIYYFDQALLSLGKESVYGKIFVDGIFTLHSAGENGGVVSPVLLLGALIGITSLLIGVYKLLNIKTRIYRTWACGNRTASNTQYSATGFTGPIRRFFYWLYKPDESIKKDNIFGYETKFSTAEYKMHVTPLFEQSLYLAPAKAINIISFWIYKLAHFEKTRYVAMIFNLLLMVLFSYRNFVYEFSWATLILESIVMIISVKILVIGEK